MECEINDVIINEFLKDIEKPRTVEEMNLYYKEIMDKVGSNTELIKLARLRKGLFKEFYEEFIPLYKFAKSEFGVSDNRYNVVIGNQKYDGIIQGPGGSIKIEISKYHDGYLKNKSAKELNSRGVTEVIVGDVNDAFDTYIHRFLNCVLEKKSKNYIDTLILFVIDAGETWCYLFDFNKDLLIERLKQGIGQIFEGSSGVYLLVEKQGDTFPEDVVIKIC
ncbi:MAG: hypothetical protein APF76_03710 [Desulfitibacter sp. BRH_c19]|nr:MAG: hypothetical protein APF76_03710 [Desulfitibacter sp. BRH_c19]